MSHKLHGPVWNTRLGNLTAKSLLAMLIEEINDDGFGFPSEAQMVQKTEINRGTVRRMIDVFEAMRLVRRYKAQVELRGELVWRKCIQVDTGKLGTDLTTEFAQCYAAAQGKEAVSLGNGRWRLHRKTLSESTSSALRDADRISESEPVLSEMKKVLSESKPPDPLIGVPLIVPSGVPSQSQCARDGAEEFDPEQQEHLDRLAAEGRDAETWRRSYAAMNCEKREAEAAAGVLRAEEAAKEAALKELYTEDRDTAIATMRKRCGFAWRAGDELGPVLRQVFDDQLEMGKPAWRTAAQMEAAWILQRSQPKGVLRARFGPMKFCGDGHWLDPNGWHWNV